MASNFSKEKGNRAENKVKEVLKQFTGLNWERTPLSGALDPKHGIKSDLYVPGKENIYAIEVKHYADDHINSGILTNKTPQTLEWWRQAERQAKQVNKRPLLIFKFDRSKLFVAFEDMPNNISYRHMLVHYDGTTEFFVALLEDWLQHEQPKFVV